MKAFPNTPDDLIKDLDVMFPEPAIGPQDSMADIQYEAGQRSVIQFIKQWRAHPAQSPTPPRRGQGRPTR